MYKNKIYSYILKELIICTLCLTLTACSKVSDTSKKNEDNNLLLNIDAVADNNKNNKNEDDNNESTKVGKISKVRCGDFDYEMFAMGKLKYTDTYYETIKAQEAAFVKYNVNAGDKVKEGDVLFTCQPQYYESSLNQQIADVEQKEREYSAGYDSRKAEINQAEHDLKSITDSSDIKIKQLEIKKLNLALTKYSETQSDVKKAREELNEYMNSVESLKVVAENSGFILSLTDFAEGDTLTKGQAVAVISPEKEYLIEVDDNSNGTLRYNDNVKVSVSVGGGLPDIEIDGKVISADNILSSNNIQKKAYVKMLNEPTEVNWNSAIKVYYKSKVIKDVLMVPSGAVLFESKGEGTNVADVPYVYIYKDGETNKRYIEVFESNNEDYLVLQGLEEGEQVVNQK